MGFITKSKSQLFVSCECLAAASFPTHNCWMMDTVYSVLSYIAKPLLHLEGKKASEFGNAKSSGLFALMFHFEDSSVDPFN